MNRRRPLHRLTFGRAFSLATLVVWSTACLWAAPPVPEPPAPSELPAPTIDEDVLRLGEDYLDLIKELDAVLTDFEEFYQETESPSLAGIAKSVEALRKSLKQNPTMAGRDELVEKLDDLVDRIDTVIDEADEGDSKMRRRHLRELEAFSEDLEDIRDELDSEFSEEEFVRLLDGEKMAKIFEQAARQAEKAMQMYLVQQQNLDSQLLILPPGTPAPVIGRIGGADRARRDYFIVKSRADYDDSLTQKASLAVRNRDAMIDLQNDIGGIEVRTWNRSEVSARLIIGFASGSNSSRAMAQGIHLQASDAGDGLSITVEYPEDRDETAGIVGSQLEVTVPGDNPVKIKNSFGVAAIADLHNSLAVANNFGSVEIKRVTGEVTIVSSTGGIYVEDVTGKLTATNSFGDVEVVGANGPVMLTNSYATVSIRNSSGELTIANSGAVAVAGHKGNLAVESSNGEVEISRVTGNVTASNSFGGMQIEVVSGEVTAENSSAALEIADVGGPVRATNRFGSIEISDAKASVRAESSNSDITVVRTGGDVIVVNRFGKVTVQSARGGVQIDNTNAVVEISDIQGGAVITNQFAPIVIDKVTGPVEVDNRNASVDLADIGGAVTVRTSFGEVSGERLSGPFLIDNTNGSVELTRLTGIAKDSQIRATSGDITIELPSAKGFNVDASTSWGRIQTDLPMKISSGGNTMSGVYTAGSGYPTLVLKGENASIIISTKP